MSESYADFHERLARIYRKQEKTGRIGRKSVAINRDGYVIVKGAGRRRNIPWTGLAMVAIAFFGVKGAVIAEFGPDFYSQNVARMAGGTTAERIASLPMKPDPVSRWVATQIKAIR